MATARLGRRTLAALPEINKPAVIYDSDLKGFGLRLTPPSGRNVLGSRTLIVEYRPGAGGRKVAKRRVSLGSVDILSPERARDMARDMLASIRLGADPAAHRAERRAAETIRELQALHREEQAPVRKATTAELYAGYWDNHILPAIGSRLASDIGKRDVAALHREIGKKHRVTANRVLTALSPFYGWAAASRHIPEGLNPCKGVERFPESGRERYLTDEELGRLGAAIRKAETTGIEWARTSQGPLSKHSPSNPANRLTRIDSDAAAAIRLLMFTGARLREILNLRWSEFDRQRRLLMIADSKTGRKTIVLGQAACGILEIAWRRATAEREDGQPASEFVFPAKGGTTPKADLQRPWAMVVREAALPGLRIDDLRHSFASIGAGAGMGLPIIGKLLGYSSPSTTARYARLDAHPLRAATDMISQVVADAMNSIPRH